jgi:DNA-binding response OmpR family regulator
VLTAHALDHYRDVAVVAGADAFLSKPCAIEDLVAEIRRVLAAPG